MKRVKKTIKVQELKDRINAQIKSAKTESARVELANLLSTILLETGNYSGFNFVEWLDGGHSQWVIDGKPEDNMKYLGDQTLRIYY